MEAAVAGAATVVVLLVVTAVEIGHPARDQEKYPCQIELAARTQIYLDLATRTKVVQLAWARQEGHMNHHTNLDWKRMDVLVTRL